MALEDLFGSQREEDEEHHNQVEAWEEALSYLEARGDLRETKRGHHVVNTSNYDDVQSQVCLKFRRCSILAL